MQIKKILKVGIPNSVENSMFQLGRLMVFSLVSTFGTNAIAANAVSQTIAMVQILPGLALGLAVTTVIARCVGAGDYDQVKYYNKKMVFITYGCMAVTILLTYLALPVLLKLYNLSPETSQITRDIMLFHSVGAIIFWPVSFTLPATFRACGDARSCMIISILSMWIFRIGFSYVLGKFMGIGVFGIWVAMVIDWVFRSICFIIRYFRGTWKKQAFV
jgi:Na+-driven multidrug efflux pump